MKILHVSNYYFPHIGGIEQTAQDIVRSLCGKGIEQRVFCFASDRRSVCEEVDGIDVVRSGCFAKVSSQSLSAGYGKRLKKQFAEFQPDVAVFHYPNPFAAHYLLKILKKYPACKLVLYWHLDITKQKILGAFFKGQSKRLLRRAAKVVATSPNYVKGSPFLRQFAEKCTVIASCVNEERLRVTDEVLKRSEQIRKENEGKILCFAVGRHVAYKGLDRLIAASKFLGENYKISIGGAGPLTEKLKAQAKGDGKIEFLGKLSDGELKAHMLACDVFCFPSVTKNEAFGLSLAEAMYFSKPAVTFTIDGSGVNYVNLNGVTGLEVENGNAEKFAQAVSFLGEHPKRRQEMGAAARERTEELFLFKNFHTAIADLFSTL